MQEKVFVKNKHDFKRWNFILDNKNIAGKEIYIH